MAAEHQNLFYTEHNRMFDWTPTIKSLGLEKVMSTVPGIELTGSVLTLMHFLLSQTLKSKTEGAAVVKDPRLNAIL